MKLISYPAMHLYDIECNRSFSKGGCMFGWFLDLITSIFRLWEKLPDSTKAKIIEGTVEAFDQLFRAYYKSQKGTSNG